MEGKKTFVIFCFPIIEDFFFFFCYHCSGTIINNQPGYLLQVMANSKTSQCCRTIYFIVLYISDHFCFIDLEFNVLIRPHWVWQKLTNSNMKCLKFVSSLAKPMKSFEVILCHSRRNLLKYETEHI